MLRTLSVTTEIKDVPNTWVFEHYLKLNQRLTGQEVKISSIFTRDSTPSFTIFPADVNRYCFKDFSSGKGGNYITLVKEMYNLSTRDAIVKIISDYNQFLMDGNSVSDYKFSEFKIRTNYKVAWLKPRQWTTGDAKFWGSYKIDSKLLERFNVKPLSSYQLVRDEPYKELIIEGVNLYGYFTKTDSCYKIYQPYTKEHKFIKISSHVQGIDQLQYDKPYLVIASSMKDMLCLYKLGFRNLEVIAPHSENTLLAKSVIERLQKKYKAICTLFDDDQAGIKGMELYKEKYGIPYAHLKVENDLADCVKAHGIRNTREWVYPLLTKALTGTLKELP